MQSGLINPFAQKYSMTSLEKVFKNGADGGNNMNGNGGEGNNGRDVIVRGVLSVTIISAEDLAPADLMGKADPYVVLTMKKTESKNKTRVCSLVELFFTQKYSQAYIFLSSLPFLCFIVPYLGLDIHGYPDCQYVPCQLF